MKKSLLLLLLCYVFTLPVFAQTNISGEISTNTIWTKAGSPYNLTGNITVTDGATLELQPGVVVEAKGHISITVLGKLISVGTEQDSIYFRGDGSKGFWTGIKIRNNGGSLLGVDYSYQSGSKIAYNSIKDADCGIYVFNTSLFIENSTFQNNKIACEHRKTTISIVKNSKFINNDKGTYSHAIPYSTLNDGNNPDDIVGSITNLKVDNCDFTDNLTAAFLEFQCNGTLNGYRITNSTFKQNSKGVQIGNFWAVYNVNNIEIDRNIFNKNTNAALHFSALSSGSNNVVKNNLFYDNNIGYYHFISTQQVFLRNNIFYKNKYAFNSGNGINLQFSQFIDNKYNVTVSSDSYQNPVNFNLSNSLFSNRNGQALQPFILFNYLQTTSNYSTTSNNFTSIVKPVIKTSSLSGTVSFSGNYIENPSNYSTYQLVSVPDSFNSRISISNTSTVPNITSPITLVKNVVKSSSTSQVVLSWSSNPESDISGYKICYGGFTGYSYANVIDVGNVTTYTLPAGVGINEDIAVTAYDTNKDGVDDQFDGNESWYSPANQAPSAPSGLAANAGPRNIKLNWSASSSSGVNKYNIYKSTDGTNFTFSTSTISNSLIDENLTPGSTYYYKVTAFDSLDASYNNYGLESGYSNIVSAIPTNRIYVNKATGNSANNGSLANPFNLLQTALNKAVNGDTVIISDHNYTERVTITGTGKKIVLGSQYMYDFDSSHIKSASLDGTGSLSNQTLLTSSSNLVIHGITIKNMIGMTIDCGTGTTLALKNVHLTNLGYNSTNAAEYIINAPKIFIDSSRVYANHDLSGLFNVQDSTSFTNSKFHDNIAGLFYYATSGGANKSFIANSSFIDNKRGVRVDYLVHNVRSVIAQKNKFLNNTLTLFSGSGASYQRFDNNLFYKNNGAINRGPQTTSNDSLILYHNTFVANSTDMNFNLSGKWKGIFHNNIITSSINFSGPTPARADYINIDIKGNVFKSYPSFAYVDTTSASNVLRSNILFKDSANLDFRLANNNPEIGLGFASAYPINGDLSGSRRPNPVGSKPDIGAYESEFSFAAPTLVSVEPTSKKVALFWSQTPSSNIKSYKVYRSNSSIPDTSSLSPITILSGASTLTYVDETAALQNGISYFYRLKSVDLNDAESGLGNELVAIPDSIGIPTNFTLNNGPKVARLNWDSNGMSGKKFKLYRSTNLISKSLLIDTLNKWSFDDTTMLPETTYYYWIRTLNSKGTLSEYSAPLTLIPTKVWRVDSARGNESTAIGSLKSPFLKISSAVQKAKSLDSIYVYPGTYSDNINYTNKELYFIGTSGAHLTKIRPLIESNIFYMDNAGNSLIKGFTLFNASSRVGGSAIFERLSTPKFENLIFRDNGGSGGIISTSSGSFTMNNCIAYNNSPNTFFELGNSVSSPAIINHFTYVKNTGFLFNSGNPNYVANFNNSIIWGATNIQYSGVINVQNSIFKGGFSSGTNIINASPYFIDSVNNNFKLQNYSPAIGLGVNGLLLNKDFDDSSRARPVNTNPDAGAYESAFGQNSSIIDSTKSIDGLLSFNWTQLPIQNVDSFIIYKDTTLLPNLKYAVTASSVKSFNDSSNSIFNTPIYIRMQTKSKTGLLSGFSNVIKSIVYTSPTILFPLDKLVKTDTALRFNWNKVNNATRYRVQISLDSTFSTTFKLSVVTDTSLIVSGFSYNKTYYWRISSEDSIKTSRWSKFYTFQTKLQTPTISSIFSTDKLIRLSFKVPSIENIDKINIYQDTINTPTNLRDTVKIPTLNFSDSVSNQILYYYRITTVNNQGVESDFSNILSAVALQSPQLIAPLNKQFKTDRLPEFSWSSVQYATRYQRQIDTTVSFNSTLRKNDTLVTTSQKLNLDLIPNTNYYWRVRSGNNTGWSNWSDTFSFQTIITPPILTEAAPANKRDTLRWIKGTEGIVSFYKIYRDTTALPTTLIDSITGDNLTYIDTIALSLKTKYYYRIKSVNKDGIESDWSNVLFASPFNAKPIPISLTSKTFNNTGEYNTIRLVYSASGSIDTDGRITNYKWHVNDSLVNQSDSILIYYFKQGLNNLKLTIYDNDGDSSTSTASIRMSAFLKNFKGGILGGITALNENTLYTADSSFDAITGASVYKIDRSGNTKFPLIVSSKIFTTPSVSSDSSVFITSGSSLNGFNSSGAPLWPALPLGGLSYVTPTIDSIQSRLYVGVSNANFLAIDYKTGKSVWNVNCDAPINSSAIITGDRKLVFASDNGTLYGFDLKLITDQPSPTWKFTVPGKIVKSPAIDSLNHLYFGTTSGNLVKLRLDSNGVVTTLWTTGLNAEVKSSPVIDANGFIYIGTESGKFYKLDPNSGNIIWSYSSTSAIRSTPTISDFGSIYIADIMGNIASLNESGAINWRYQDSSAISSNLLSINNMLYVGTEGGKLIGFYDNPNTNTVNTSYSYNFQKNKLSSSLGSLASQNNFDKIDLNNLADQLFAPVADSKENNLPIWGTFQGNYRRTGSKKFECPEVPIIQIPNCVTPSDSIQISTNNMVNRYWIVNEVKLTNITSTSIVVKKSDKYKLEAFNSIGCIVSSGNPVFIQNTDIEKPKILASNGTGQFCEGDSLSFNFIY
jgi:hypothetical protein